jgi:hypothetical protein
MQQAEVKEQYQYYLKLVLGFMEINGRVLYAYVLRGHS